MRIPSPSSILKPSSKQQLRIDIIKHPSPTMERLGAMAVSRFLCIQPKISEIAQHKQNIEPQNKEQQNLEVIFRHSILLV